MRYPFDGCVKVIKCQPGPEPKKITARARSENLKQHLEGFMSVNMTDENAQYADALFAPLKPVFETLETHEEKWKRFFNSFTVLYQDNLYVEFDRVLEVVRDIHSRFPGFMSLEEMVEVVAIVLGYKSYSQMEEKKFFTTFLIKKKTTVDVIMKTYRDRQPK